MNDYHDFLNRFNIQKIHVARDRNYETIDYGSHTSRYYTSICDETIEMELSRSGFEELVRMDRKLEGWIREAGDEAYMRGKHPALKEAYDKYKMLMELYR